MSKPRNVSKPIRAKGLPSPSANKQSTKLAAAAASDDSDPGDWKLLPSQVRELKRRAADLDDPIRYLLVSRFGPRFALYYNVSDDVYAMNDPKAATLFKRRKAAESIKAMLGPRTQLVKCRTRRQQGLRIPIVALSSVQTKPRERKPRRLSRCQGAI